MVRERDHEFYPEKYSQGIFCPSGFFLPSRSDADFEMSQEKYFSETLNPALGLEIRLRSVFVLFYLGNRFLMFLLLGLSVKNRLVHVSGRATLDIHVR